MIPAITTGKKKVPVVCLAGCQFLVLAITTGKKKVPVVCLAGWFWRLRPEKKSSSRLSGGLCCCGSGDYDRKKKSSSRLSGGLSVFGSGDYDRKKKKFQSSVWRVVDYDLCRFLVLAGNWQFFCCGGKFSLRPEKKKFQSSVWRVRDQLRPENKKDTGGKFSF